MIRLLTTCVVLQFWAAPNHKMSLSFARSGVRHERAALKLKVYDPGITRDNPSPQRSAVPDQFPTDVPVPEPRDVPPPQPIDDPPPSPGKQPEPGKPQKRPAQDPKPRPVP
jgi:hypothetical protein